MRLYKSWRKKISYRLWSKRSSLKNFLISPHPSTNFEIQAYYQNEPRFNGVYSRDNLPDKIKDGAYIINLDEYSDIGTHWVALYVISSIEISSVESIEHNSIDTSNLNNQQFRLNKISEIEDYFITEIKERELMSKKLSKYISFFDYFDKSLIFLSVTSGSISIASFAAVIGTPVVITSASLSLTFSLCTGLVKKLLKARRKKKKKHNKILC